MVPDEEYEHSGNVLLDELLGAKIVDRLPAGTDMQAAMEDLAKDLRAAGKRPYVIPGGGSNPGSCTLRAARAPRPGCWLA